MHDELIGAGRCRLLAATAAGLALLAVSAGLLVLPLVWAAGAIIAVAHGTDLGWGLLGRAAALSLVLGLAGGGIFFVVSVLRSEHRVTETVGVRVTPVPDDRRLRLTNLVAGLSLAAGVPPPHLAVIGDPAPNCLTVGRTAGTAWIVVTTGLLDSLSRDELEAVLAYELGRVATLEVSLDTVVYASTAVAFELWVGAFGGLDELSVVLVPLALLASPLVLAGVGLRRWTLRARARLADGLAIAYCRNPEALLRALRTVEADPRTIRVAGLTTDHLWLAYPHTRSSRWVLGSRRILGERVARLERALGPVDGPEGQARP
ncbi:MAG: M48 family metalloprotease [Acidimicrobiales bacterium]|nr:M48 family metalloprotease [Acidimicrobiales bacterium]